MISITPKIPNTNVKSNASNEIQSIQSSILTNTSHISFIAIKECKDFNVISFEDACSLLQNPHTQCFIAGFKATLPLSTDNDEYMQQSKDDTLKQHPTLFP